MEKLIYLVEEEEELVEDYDSMDDLGRDLDEDIKPPIKKKPIQEHQPTQSVAPRENHSDQVLRWLYNYFKKEDHKNNLGDFDSAHQSNQNSNMESGMTRDDVMDMMKNLMTEMSISEYAKNHFESKLNQDQQPQQFMTTNVNHRFHLNFYHIHHIYHIHHTYHIHHLSYLSYLSYLLFYSAYLLYLYLILSNDRN